MDKPYLTALAYSGGKQSSLILWMVLLGDIPRPKGHFIVLNADPGMENKNSLPYVNMMESECRKQTIPFIRVKRNLYAELLALKTSGKKRFDTPPFWTKNRETGTIGRLMQTCTLAYKIAPMDRAMRQYMQTHLNIPANRKRMGNNIVEKWIGFSFDEWHRVKESNKKYVYCEYPLIRLRMTNADVDAYFAKNGLPIPPRSVCNACFANDFSYLQQMWQERPEDWAQAVAVDEAIRDLTCIGIRDECYVFSGCVPLQELADRAFVVDEELKKEADIKCHSGHCFI